MKKFCEFLDAKAKEAVVADYKGVLAVTPPKDGKYPATPVKEGEKLPYKGKGEDQGLMSVDNDDKTAFGDMPHPNMTPEKAMPMGEKPKKDIKHVKQGGKLKEFFDVTRKMNNSEFISYMRESVTGTEEIKMHNENGEVITPHPHEVIAYAVSLMHNPRIVSRLVSEASRQGKLSELVQDLLDHPEFAKELHAAIGETNEAVTAPIVNDEKEDGKDVIPQPEKKKPVKMMKKK